MRAVYSVQLGAQCCKLSGRLRAAGGGRQAALQPLWRHSLSSLCLWLLTRVVRLFFFDIACRAPPSKPPAAMAGGGGEGRRRWQAAAAGAACMRVMAVPQPLGSAAACVTPPSSACRAVLGAQAIGSVRLLTYDRRRCKQNRKNEVVRLGNENDAADGGEGSTVLSGTSRGRQRGNAAPHPRPPRHCACGGSQLSLGSMPASQLTPCVHCSSLDCVEICAGIGGRAGGSAHACPPTPLPIDERGAPQPESILSSSRHQGEMLVG